MIELLQRLIADLRGQEDDPAHTYPHRLPVTREAQHGDVVALQRYGEEQRATVALVTREALGLHLERGAVVEYRQDVAARPLPLVNPDQGGKLYVW